MRASAGVERLANAGRAPTARDVPRAAELAESAPRTKRPETSAALTNCLPHDRADGVCKAMVRIRERICVSKEPNAHPALVEYTARVDAIEVHDHDEARQLTPC